MSCLLKSLLLPPLQITRHNTRQLAPKWWKFTRKQKIGREGFRLLGMGVGRGLAYEVWEKGRGAPVVITKGDEGEVGDEGGKKRKY